MDEWYKPVELAIGHIFQDKDLLRQSLTHRSYVNEHPEIKMDCERLEFLGDAVLGLLISHKLWTLFPEGSEGELTLYKSLLVSETYLAHIARKLNLGQFLFLGKGEEQTRGRDKDSILADIYEAVVAAIFLDTGFGNTVDIVESHFPHIKSELVSGKLCIADEESGKLFVDYKSRLQELVQQRYKTVPKYKVIRVKGPDHERTFFVIVTIEGKFQAEGQGRSKKEAEEDAAKQAITRFEDQSR